MVASRDSDKNLSLIHILEELPLSAKAAVRKADPVEGLKRAIAALSKDAGNFGELSALYIRKSQAEENRKDV